jgi:hypothetical protein
MYMVTLNGLSSKIVSGPRRTGGANTPGVVGAGAGATIGGRPP